MEKLPPRFKNLFAQKCPKRTSEGLCTFGIPGFEPRPTVAKELTVLGNLNLTGKTPLVIRLCESNLESACNGNPNNLFCISDPVESANISIKH